VKLPPKNQFNKTKFYLKTFVICLFIYSIGFMSNTSIFDVVHKLFTYYFVYSCLLLLLQELEEQEKFSEWERKRASGQPLDDEFEKECSDDKVCLVSTFIATLCLDCCSLSELHNPLPKRLRLLFY